MLALLLPLLQLVPGIIAEVQALQSSGKLTPEEMAQIDAALEAANNALQTA